MIVYGFHLSHCEKLICEFEDVGYVQTYYSCIVKSMDNSNNKITITEHTGVHKANKNDNDVKGIYMNDVNPKYIPANLGSLFKLTSLEMQRSNLIEIKSKDFEGMQNLENLILLKNGLTSVPMDAFVTLPNLRIIFLSYNEIEELPNGIFSNNPNLEHIHLYKNNIKFLGSGLFNGLMKLNKVDLRVNYCVSEQFEGTSEIMQLKNDIKMNCFNPNEVPAPKTLNAKVNEFKTTLSNFFDNLFKKLLKANNELKNQTMDY